MKAHSETVTKTFVCLSCGEEYRDEEVREAIETRKLYCETCKKFTYWSVAPDFSLEVEL